MSVYPIIWAIEHAPVIDAEERAILAALVTKGDFDGCNCYRSFASLTRVACVDRRTAMRKVKAMTDRGLLRDQLDPKPESWHRLPADKRPVVREAMIPASFWSATQLGEINEAREARGRAPITPFTRPELREAPPKKTRKDKGTKKSERGDTETPGDGVTSSHPAEGLQDTSRGDSESPNPPMGPSDGPSSSSVGAPDEPPAPAAERPAPKKTKKPSPEQIVMERPDATDDEAKAVVDYIEQQGTGTPEPIRSLTRWIEGRDDRDLARDLAHVRAPESPAGSLYERDPGAYWKGVNKGYRGGTRAPLPSREEYDALAALPQDRLAAVVMGDAPPPGRAPQGSVGRRQRESDDLFDRAMERALQREAAMETGD
ncbi:hypothetical protein [Halostreptopolyspora alba]|uniref:Helix-turn-helix domain-containing protein n=1 Tax=Halostreptopolyspora alba TaxID=2487137 RepID=A0A3N0EFH7_9ACTN|nr:hypothetical protein EFW17_05475 [Nocardiopsaceae bacterium YIM 96095]